jgi:hypothetical protein
MVVYGVNYKKYLKTFFREEIKLFAMVKLMDHGIGLQL